MRAHLRSRQATLLTASALLLCLALGVAFVVVHRLDVRGSAADPAARPLSDDQTMAQVVQAAREFVGTGRLRNAGGTYILASCTAADEPPYQGAVYLNFDVPKVSETQTYFRGIARAMTELGWVEGLPPNGHPDGRILTRDGVNAVYYRDPEAPGRGVLQIHGECRNVTDHSQDTSTFVDITGLLTG